MLNIARAYQMTLQKLTSSQKLEIDSDLDLSYRSVRIHVVQVIRDMAARYRAVVGFLPVIINYRRKSITLPLMDDTLMNVLMLPARPFDKL